MIEVQCPSTLKIKQLNNRSLVCQQLDIQRVSNLLAMIQHVGLFSEFLLKQGIHNSLCAPTWAHGRTLLYLWYKDMGFQWCWFWLPLLILHYYGVCHKKKEKRFNINAKIPGCSTVSRGGTECVCFSGHSDLQSHARYSERVRVQGAMLWHSMSQLCAHYVQHYVLQ